MDWMELLYKLIPYIVTILIGIFGSYFVIFKGKLAQVKKAVDIISDAVEDGEITEPEARAIVTAIRELLGLDE